MEQKSKCRHGDGWILSDAVVIDSSLDDTDDLEANFICNSFSCSEKRRFRFDITNVRKVKQ
jgi:hypothetical protein